MKRLTPFNDLDLHDFPNEQWKDIPQYEGYYQISSYGRVKSLSRLRGGPYASYYTKERILSQSKVYKGQWTIGLSKHGKTVTKHIMSLVGVCFIGKKKKGENYYHIDKDPDNNHVSNIGIIHKRYMNPETHYQQRYVFVKLDATSKKELGSYSSRALKEVYGPNGFNAIFKVCYGRSRHQTAYGYAWKKKLLD